MTKMFDVLLLGVFLMLFQNVNAEPLLIVSSVIERDASYARIATNAEYVIFFLQNLLPPTPRQECSLGSRKIEWKVSPETVAGHSDSSQEMFRVNFSNPDDFGTSYKISVSVSWSMIDNKTGLYAKPIVKTAMYTLDAIMYSFAVACSDGTSCLDGVSPLVDNHPAVAKVVPQGCTRRNLLRMKLTSTPQKKNPVNKAGTSMLFSRSATDTCTFTTPKTYWYGLPHPNDCFFLQYYYIINLESDFVIVAQKKETVGWPDAEDELKYLAKTSKCTMNFRLLSDNRTRIVVENLRMQFDIKRSQSTHQYSFESAAEELYHEKQLTGEVDVAHGGFGDLFDLNIAMFRAGFTRQGAVYIRDSEPGQSSEEFFLEVADDIERNVMAEIDFSYATVDANRGYMEKCAKDHAGYNAAFRYHCTYGNPNSGVFFQGLEESLSPRNPR